MLFHYFEKGISLRRAVPVSPSGGQGQDEFSHLFIMQVFQKAPGSSHFLKFTFNNNDRLPCYIPVEQERQHYDAITVLMKMIADPANQLRFRLRPDQLLVTNNWRVMHGRTQFTGSRRLVGAYVSMEDFLSATRLLGGRCPAEGLSP
jgi:hypothetical protein